MNDSTRAEGVVDAVFARIKSNKDIGGIVETAVAKSFSVVNSDSVFIKVCVGGVRISVVVVIGV